jgi:hypothetical protein
VHHVGFTILTNKTHILTILRVYEFRMIVITMTTDSPCIKVIVTLFRTSNFLRTKETRKLTFSKSVPNSSLRERNGDGTEVAEKYSRAITQAARRLCCGRSCSSISEFWISNGFPGTYVGLHSFPSVYSLPNCAKFDLRRTFRDASTA